MGTFETGLIQAAPQREHSIAGWANGLLIALLSHLARSASAVVRQVLLAWDRPTRLLRVGEALAAAYSSLTEGIATASWVGWIRAVADDRQDWANHNTCAGSSALPGRRTRLCVKSCASDAKGQSWVQVF
jgi:hypothetical protein